MRFEDESVGTVGGKGEEFKTQDNRNGSGIGVDIHGGGSGSSEKTEDSLNCKHGVHGSVSVLIDVWKKISVELIDQRRIDDNDDTTASQQFK